MTNVPSFNKCISYYSPDTGQGIAIDPDQHLFAFLMQDEVVQIVEFRELIAVDVIRDETTLQITNRGSQAVGAIVGAVLAGPLGAMVGGLSGSRRFEAKIKRLALRLTTSNLVRPVNHIPFFTDPLGTTASDARVRQAAARLALWHGRFQGILTHAGANFAAEPMQPKPVEIPRQRERAERLGGAAWLQPGTKSLRRNAIPTSPNQNRLYRLRLKAIGDRRPNVIAAVRQIAGLSLQDAAEFVDAAPEVPFRGMNREQADIALALLLEAGASVRREVDGNKN